MKPIPCRTHEDQQRWQESKDYPPLSEVVLWIWIVSMMLVILTAPVLASWGDDKPVVEIERVERVG